jgi:hypothetical protein
MGRQKLPQRPSLKDPGQAQAVGQEGMKPKNGEIGGIGGFGGRNFVWEGAKTDRPIHLQLFA